MFCQKKFCRVVAVMSQRALASIHFDKYSIATAVYCYTHNVDAPPCEGPDRRYELDFFWRKLVVMGVLLTIWAHA